MELYTETSYELSRKLTLRYSTSFGKSTQLFSPAIRPHIFAIYGLVRIADEIVDTYRQKDSKTLLNELENETYRTLKSGYSTNPIVHSFAQTARTYGITKTLIAPFFESMRMDLTPKDYTPELYATYIDGSAEVIGLMCLKVFVMGDTEQYKKLEHGARALGAAYQKANFLRDIASDYADRGRIYFPGITLETFSEADKQTIVADIAHDFAAAKTAIENLPSGARRAVTLSYRYYSELLTVLQKTPAETLKKQRVRVPDSKKFALLAKTNMEALFPWQK